MLYPIFTSYSKFDLDPESPGHACGICEYLRINYQIICFATPRWNRKISEFVPVSLMENIH